jgi:DNA (cytosine-5)-methyltransferase 1
MKAISLFSGCAGGDIGLARAGITTVLFCEIDPYPRSVLRYHSRNTEPGPPPIIKDIRALAGGRKMKRWLQERYELLDPVDLIHCSSPCQDLSVAGKRAGMAGLKSSLFFRSIRVWKLLDCKHFLWENVPGALSSAKGEDFTLVLSALVGGRVARPTKRWPNAGLVAGPDGVASWRILDLRHFGPAQRCRRLFVFASRAGGVDPEQVLLERESVRGDPESRGLSRKEIARRTRASLQQKDRDRGADGTLAFNWQNGGGYGDANDGLAITEGATGPLDRSQIKAVIAYDTTQITSPENRSNPQDGDPCHPLAARAHPPLVVGTLNGSGAGTARTSNERSEADMIVTQAGLPRRLMPIECERLMGWPAGYTAQGITDDGKEVHLSDTQRYKMCGNGEGAPVLHWIGKRFVSLFTEDVPS